MRELQFMYDGTRLSYAELGGAGPPLLLSMGANTAMLTAARRIPTS